jgi:hypothetical protein
MRLLARQVLSLIPTTAMVFARPSISSTTAALVAIISPVLCFPAQPARGCSVSLARALHYGTKHVCAAKSSPTVGVSRQGLKPQSFLAALIGPAKAVPLLQSHDRDTATHVLL